MNLNEFFIFIRNLYFELVSKNGSWASPLFETSFHISNLSHNEFDTCSWGIGQVWCGDAHEPKVVSDKKCCPCPNCLLSKSQGARVEGSTGGSRTSLSEFQQYCCGVSTRPLSPGQVRLPTAKTASPGLHTSGPRKTPRHNLVSFFLDEADDRF